MNISIKKFGGSSIGSIARINQVAERVALSHKKGEKIVLVASAMAGDTDRLDQMAKKFHFNHGLAYDMLLASGEQVSVSLLSLALETQGVKAQPILAYQLGIQTDSIFSEARIKNINTDLILQILKENKIPVVAGFQGVNSKNQITTLGRGGSDTTAVALTAALQQDTCEVYTDVPSIYTADPRKIPQAQKIHHLSFDEMMEMAILGAKVLHFRCVELASKFNIKIHLRSSFEKEGGTWVSQKEENMENPIVSSVLSDENITVIKLFPIPMGVEFISHVFHLLSKESILVDVISQSYNQEGQRLAFSIKEEKTNRVIEILSSLIEKDKISIVQNVCKVSIIGVGMAHHSGVAAKFFDVLNQTSAHLHLVTTSDIKISAIIDKKDVSKVMRKLHHTFITNPEM